MRIFQLLPTFSVGDAIGNEVLVINQMLLRHGYETYIVAANVSVRNGRKINSKVKTISHAEEFCENDIIIYHFSIGHPMNQMLIHCRGKKILRYHNITPPEFFKGYDWISYENCRAGYKQLMDIKEKIDVCIADSEYNAEDLRKAGYKCPIQVLPIVLSMKEYSQRPAWKTFKRYRDNWTNILFTGRVVPNKKHEDVIDVFYYYKKYINDNSRLIFAGNFDSDGLYYKDLCRYIERLKLQDVIFTGYLDFKELAACYHLADLFLCMSQHEGFCVPLVEAMIYGIPIIARSQTAVKETMGQAGILLEDADPKLIAELVEMVLMDNGLRTKIIQSEQERLKYFDENRIKKRFLQYIQDLME